MAPVADKNLAMAAMQKNKKKQGQTSRALRLSFNKRKDCIKKKTMELSVLCDIKACAVIHDLDGKVETWPEKPSEAHEVLHMYKNYGANHNKKYGDDDDNGVQPGPCAEDAFYKGRVSATAFTPVGESLTDLLKRVDAKLEAVNEKIARLNVMNMQSLHMAAMFGSHHESPLQHAAMEPAVPISAVPTTFWCYDPADFLLM